MIEVFLLNLTFDQRKKLRMRSEIHLLIYTQWSFFSPKRLWKGDRVVSTAWSYKNIYVCLNLSHRCYALLFHFQLKCVFSCVIQARVWPFLISVIHSSQNTELAYILYNDQRPPVDFGDRWIHNSGSSGGHTKGERRSSQDPIPAQTREAELCQSKNVT